LKLLHGQQKMPFLVCIKPSSNNSQTSSFVGSVLTLSNFEKIDELNENGSL